MSINLPYYRPSQQVLDDGKKNTREYDTDFIKLKDGRNLLRILPPWDEKGEFAVRISKHWKIPGYEKPIPCLGAWPQLGLSCPICEVLANVSNGVNKDSLAQYRPVKGVQINVLDRLAIHYGEKPKIKILQASITVYSQICNALSDPKFMDALSPINGTDVEVVRTGQNLDTKYAVNFLTNNALSPIDPPPIQTPLLQATEQEIRNLLNELPNLNKVFHPPYADELDGIWVAAKKLYEHLINQFRIDPKLIPSGIMPLTMIPVGIPQRGQQGAQASSNRMDSPPGQYPQQPMNTAPAPQPAPVAAPVQAVAPQAAPMQAPAPQPQPVPVQAPVPTQAPVQPQPAPQPVQATVTSAAEVPVRFPEAPAGVEVNPAATAIRQELQGDVIRGKPGKPSCYGGLQPHEMGIGFNVGRADCMVCIYETECGMDLEANRKNGLIR